MLNTNSMEDIFLQFKQEQERIINDGLNTRQQEEEDQNADLPTREVQDNIDKFDEWVQSIGQKWINEK